MSAGGLSYSALTNHGKVTLPSVETWGTNMNILRDPPKSIYTRKIDKVGDKSDITAMIDDSGDRSSEAIMVYARGVNPSVSVSYSNVGNNGGQGQAGKISGLNNTTSAKLPYPIMRDGVFRPPVLRQEQLLPLSRQPRVWTSQFSQPGFTDFSKRVKNCGTAEETKEVHTNLLQGTVRPTAVYKIETPIQETYDIKNNIQNIINTQANSGHRTLDITQQNVQVPAHQIFDLPLHANANTNKAHSTIQILNNNLDTERYLQTPNYNVVNSNKAQPATQILNNNLDTERYLQTPNYNVVNSNKAQPTTQILNNNLDTERYLQTPNYNVVNSNTSSNTTAFTSIDELIDLPEMPIQNVHVINHTAPYSRDGDGTTYIHKDLERNRQLPTYSGYTNRTDNTKYKRQETDNTIELERNIPSGQMYTNTIQRGENNNSSREVTLLPKINVGDYNIPASKPLENHIQEIPVLRETDKQRMSRLVMESQSRYGVEVPKN
jgi:hypothetical protein